MLRVAYQTGARAALEKLGLTQPSLNQVGMARPGAGSSGLPGAAPKMPGLPTPSFKLEPEANPAPSLGQRAAKLAANVGMGASTERHEGPGAVPGEPADIGRRQRSVIDRTFQQNEDFFGSSPSPAPGAVVSP